MKLLTIRQGLNSLFKNENPLYLIKNVGIVEVNALCGTRSFNEACKRLPSEIRLFNGNSDAVEYTIVRDEKHRLVSAYNKKVLATNTDWRKYILLFANGLSTNIQFVKYIDTLIDAKKSGLIIDKHFRPCTALSNNRIELDQFIEVCDNNSIKLYLNENKIRSSSAMLAEKAYRLESLNNDVIKKINLYLGLYL